MSDILITVLVFIIVILITVIVVRKRAANRRKSEEKTAQSRPQDPFAAEQNTGGDPETIKAGDLLEFGNEKFFVRGTLRISEGGYNWAEHFFQADQSATRLWLTVENDPDLQVSRWRDRPDLDIEPKSKTITIEDTEYELVEHGTASYKAEGTTGLNETGGVDYVDYESGNGKLLAFERFDHGRWEVSTGESIPVGSFTIYSGS
ncbi:MAG: DUF4178 domain-containing protein [Brevibacterium sp.]|uniref:DUF4178 domain-containing protein n=1 Tax=Brevibacterium sp. TaxID=1701 RepID=UPI002649F3BC|nr:DUF4178 domain-containing protein [Brevibacterium sp.]MDN5806842.1 DUF4178 domain-containing protein [Brevibacterium sp.]MDN5832937.1 DUF4178 domain-containing protein [Brevibacterium sp.]MDN5875580.1 DUF4178 domain-containing protein [Brevibacterium sp.]MDN5909888.1 DUF4178 domain-containing protein [Brevibacterium sp.]MDN6123973.1 DUF4178 domain-containing protein [Brevibacterium sp.]